MQIIKSNTLALFRNFSIDEIQLPGVWRVALSETIFTTEIENIVEGNLLLSAWKNMKKLQKGLQKPMLSRHHTMDQKKGSKM